MVERPRGWTPRVIEGGAAGTSKKENLSSLSTPEVPREEALPAQSLETAAVPTLGDLQYLLVHNEILANIPPRVDHITDFIFSLKGYNKSDANITLRREGISTFSLEQLADHLLNSTEMDWKTRPSFYGAVILEYDRKLKRALALMPDDEGQRSAPDTFPEHEN